jgi:HSP20 family protein
MRSPLDWPDAFRSWPLGLWPARLDLLDTPSDIRLEEFDSDHHHVIRAEVPGIDPDKDVVITVDGNLLSLDITREQRKEHTGADGYRSEFAYGHLHRSVRLPHESDAQDVKAKYADGILEIKVKTNGAHPARRRVPVERQ